MKRRLLISLTAACSLEGAASTLLFDFGQELLPSSESWNNLDQNTSELESVVDRLGNVVPEVRLEVTDPFFAGLVGYNGTEAPEGAAANYPTTATSDYAFGQTFALIPFPAIPNAGFKLSNLNPELEYTFSFFASRMDDDPNVDRTTSYTVTGSTKDTVSLDATNNTSQFARVFDMLPDNNNEISVFVEAGQSNNSSVNGELVQYFYLNTMQVEFRPTSVPEPGTSVLFAIGSLLIVRRKRQSK